jgi:hypothetical protein
VKAVATFIVILARRFSQLATFAFRVYTVEASPRGRLAAIFSTMTGSLSQYAYIIYAMKGLQAIAVIFAFYAYSIDTL